MCVNQNVLLISPFFYPESISTGKYNTALAEALVERGANVTVIASHPLYPGWKPVKSDSELQGVKIIRGGANVHYSRWAVLRRLVLESWFAWHSFFRAVLLRERVDVVVAILPPSLFAISLSALFPKAHRVGIVHDLQGVHAKAHGGLVARIAGAIERAAFRRFDLLVFLSKSMSLRATSSCRIAAEKIDICYPFVTLKPGTTRGALEAAFPTGYQHVVYSGALGKKQNPEQLMKAFEMAAEQMPNVMFHLFSEGPVFDALMKKHMAGGEQRIVFHGLVPEDDLAELYARSDVQVVPQADKTSDGAFPSKLPNLLASGCAVLAICERESELNDVIRRTGTGVVHNGWEIQAIVNSLKKLVARVSNETHFERAHSAEPVLREMFGVGRLLDLILGEKMSPSRAPEQTPAVAQSRGAGQ